jgi:peptide/nickel transport system permease protein
MENNKSVSLLKVSLIRLTKNRLAMTGLCLLALLVLVAIFADFISPYNPNMQIPEFSSKPVMSKGKVLLKANNLNPIPFSEILAKTDTSIIFLDNTLNQNSLSLSELKGKSEKDFVKNMFFVLGTDRYGRDVLSRLIYGSRISLSVGLISEFIAVIIGILLGSLAGYFRGFTDKFIMWIVSVVWAFPSILFVIAISVVLGKGFWQAFVAIGLTSWVDIARIVRGQIISQRELEYIDAAKVTGLPFYRIIFRHLLPNCMSAVIVTATVGLASAIIFEASLSFLGLGVQPPTASWGQMIFDGYKYIIAGTNWTLALLPGAAILLTVFCVNLLGDGLRDAFDVNLKNN